MNFLANFVSDRKIEILPADLNFFLPGNKIMFDVI